MITAAIMTRPMEIALLKFFMAPLQWLMSTLSHGAHAVAVMNITKFQVRDVEVVAWDASGDDLDHTGSVITRHRVSLSASPMTGCSG